MLQPLRDLLHRRAIARGEAEEDDDENKEEEDVDATPMVSLTPNNWNVTTRYTIGNYNR